MDTAILNKYLHKTPSRAPDCLQARGFAYPQRMNAVEGEQNENKFKSVSGDLHLKKEPAALPYMGKILMH